MFAKEEIMSEILNIRYESPKQERILCSKLLANADDDYTKAFARTYLGDAFHSLGLLDNALRECQMALELSEKNGYEKLSLTLYNILGIIYTYVEDEQGALDCFFKGIALAKKVEEHMMSAAIHANLAYMYGKFYKYDKSLDTLQKAIEINDSATNNEARVQLGNLFFYRNKANVLLEKGEYESAHKYLELIKEETNINEDINLLILYAIYYTKLKDIDNATFYIDKIRDRANTITNKLDKITVYFELIELYLFWQQYDEAESIVDICDDILEEIKLPNKYVKLAEYKIEIYTNINKKDKLIEAYRLFYEKDRELTSTRQKAEVKRIKKKIALHNEMEKHATMQAKQEELISKSECDELTAVFNRRGIRKYLEMKYMESQKSETNIAIIIIDVDYFKEYNDTYGHLLGDECLKSIAKALNDAVKDSGFVGRYGGDEFLIVASNKTEEEIEKIIVDIRNNIEELQLENVNSKVSNMVTVTIGAVNTVPKKDTDLLEYMHAADNALYEIKKKSRNGYHITNSL